MVVLVGLLDHTIYRWLLGILLFLLFMHGLLFPRSTQSSKPLTGQLVPLTGPFWEEISSSCLSIDCLPCMCSVRLSATNKSHPHFFSPPICDLSLPKTDTAPLARHIRKFMVLCCGLAFILRFGRRAKMHLG